MRARTLFFVIILVSFFSCKKEYPNLNTKVIGHAGESVIKSRSKYPPDTYESVERALELGAHGVEVDVQLTADQVLVAYHDLRLEDNSDGNGCINDLTYTEVKEISVYGSDEKIDRLEDIFQLVLGQGKELMLDVKHYNECAGQTIDYNLFDQALGDLLLNYSEAEKNKLIINSSDFDLLNTISDTSVRLSFEYDDPDYGLNIVSAYDYDMLTTKLSKMNSTITELLQDQGKQLSIFNVKTRAEVKQALQFGPDFVISDNICYTLKEIDG